MAVSKKKTAAKKSQSKPKPAAKKASKSPSKGGKSSKAAKPVTPVKKAAKPAKPSKTKPTAPAKPSKTVKALSKLVKAAAKPVKAVAKLVKAAAKPAEPAKPSKPAKPVTVTKPSKPMKAAKPSKSEKPAEPVAETRVALEAGATAPSFELHDEKGETVSSDSLAGKPYLLYFYPKDDTPGCTKEACDIRDNFGRFGQQGLKVLGVSPDSHQSHAKFGQKYGLPYTLLSDPDKQLANAYGVWGKKQNYGKEYMGIIRSSFLVGADGVIKKAYHGVKVDGHVSAVLEDAAALL